MDATRAPLLGAYRGLRRRLELETWPLVVSLGVVQVLGTYWVAHWQTARQPVNGLGVALLLVGPVALLARRRAPVASLAVILASTLAYLLVGFPYGPVLLSFILSVYTAVVEGHRVAAWSAAAILYAGHFGLRALFHEQPPSTLGQIVVVGAWLLVLMVAAEFMSARHAQARELERTQQEEGRRRLSEERLRIARDVHDVVAHNISLINVQASVALHLIDQQPEQARVALTTIKQASKDGLAELASILGALRGSDESAPRGPARGLADIDDLVADAALADVEVRVERVGVSRALPAALDLAAFRIVQESLTNVCRHAQARHATVTLRYGPDAVTLTIEDDGSDAAAAARSAVKEGYGLSGMRERATAVGGEFAAEALRGGGFRVTARLPLGETP